MDFKTYLSFCLLCGTSFEGLSLDQKEATVSEVLVQPVISNPISSIAVHSAGLGLTSIEPGVQIFLEDSPCDHTELKNKLEPFLGQCMTQNTLDQIKSIVAGEYKRNNRPVVAVFFPEQDLCQGILDVEVLEGKIGSVQAVGNRFTSPKRLLNQVGLESGDPIDADALFTRLAWWNRTPFRYTEAVLAQGSQSGTTNLELVTKDRFGLRPYVGADNTGNDETGIARIFAGVQTANLLSFDQQLTYQFTTALDRRKFYAHSGNYLLPLAWRHQFQVFGGYSKIHAKSFSTGIDSSGNSIQASGRYEIPFNPIYGSFLHWIRIGYDYKRTNNNLLFGGDTIASASPAINQFMVGYYMDLKGTKYLFSSNIEIVFSPANLTGNQNNTDFQLLRPLAKSKYVYGRVRASHTQFLHYDWSIAASGALQLSNQNLLPSEQFGLGGYETVRGYEEREVNGDNASLLSVEFRAPPVRPMQWALNKKIRDEWMFYGFIDFGYAWEHKSVPGSENTFWLLGVGPGMRYSLGTYVDLRADFGFPLHSTGLGRNSLGRWDIGATVSY